MDKRKCDIEFCQISTLKKIKTVEDFKSNREEIYYRFDGIISIENGKLQLSYDNEDGENFKYFGEEIGEGHWKLNLTDGEETASLHSFPKSKILEGYWINSDVEEQGFWRVHIKQ